MKRILFFIACLVSIGAHAQVSVVGELVPAGGGTFPIVGDYNLKGGFHSVHDTAARDAIATLRRSYGMLVYDSLTNTTWQLKGDLTNGSGNVNWKIFGSGSGMGKSHRIAVWQDTIGMSYSDGLVDSAGWFIHNDSVLLNGEVQINNCQTETVAGDFPTVLTANNYLRKTVPYAHVIKVTYPAPVYSVRGNDTLFLTPPSTKVGCGLTDVIAYSDTTAILASYLKAISLSLPAPFASSGFSYGAHQATGSLNWNNQNASSVFAGPLPGSSAGAPTFRSLQLAEVSDSLMTLADSNTVTFDLNKSREATITLTGNGHTLAFTHLPTGNRTIICRLRIVQDASGGHSFNPPSGSLPAWGKASPALNTNANGITDWVITYEATTGNYYIKSCTF